jgi:hypothetical protein
MERFKIIAISALLIFSTRPLQSETCQFRNKPNEEKVAYLSKVGPDETDPCVPYLIRWLGIERYEPAAPVLVRFLDFRQSRENDAVGAEYYPAEEALVRIGKAALPSILQVMESDDASTPTRQIAVDVWMRIYRSEAPNGIAALRKAATDAGNAIAKKRLLTALAAAVNRCIPEDKAACEVAAAKSRKP